MQIGTVSGLWLCRRPWTLKINIRRCLVYFRKSHVCANMLDVPETDVSFTLFYRGWNHLLGAGSRMDGIPALTLWDLVIEIFHSVPNKIEQPKRRAPGKPVAGYQAKHAQSHPIQAHQCHFNWHWPHSIQHNAFWCWCHVVCLWGQRGRDQDDYQRSKSHNKSCSGFVFDRINFGPNNPNPLHWLQASNRRHPNERWFHAWWVVSYCDKVLCRIKSDCIEKSGDADSFGETRQQDEYWTKLTQRSFSVSSEMKGCILWRVEGRVAGRPAARERRKFRKNWWFWIWAMVLQACSSK